MVAMANEDKDLSSIESMPDPDAKPTPAAQGDALATAIQNTATGITTDNGKTPEQVGADAAAAATATRNLATTAVTVADAVRILKAAAAAWKKDAPKKTELDAAEKAVTDAKAALATAQQAYDDSLSDSAKALAQLQVNKANTDLDKAVKDLAALKAKRKSADEAFDKEWKKAVAKLNSLTKRTVGTGTGTDTSTSPGTQSTGAAGADASAGKPGSGTPTGTPKPTGSTPSAATPSSEKPSGTTNKSSDTDTAALAAALAGQGQQNQQGQGQQAQPAAVSQPQQQNQGDKDKGKDDPSKTLLEEATRNGEQALTAAGIVNPTTSSPVTNPSPTPAPVANANGTTFRPTGTQLPGVGLNSAPPVNQQAAATSGTSQTGLTTQTDVTGRPPGTENKAFSATPGGAETKTSGASGGNTAQQAAQQQAGQRGTGMPMMPMVPPSGSPAVGGGGRGGDGETKPGVSSTSDPLGLMHERSHAVDGGTIAQNRPDRDKPHAA